MPAVKSRETRAMVMMTARARLPLQPSLAGAGFDNGRKRVGLGKKEKRDQMFTY